VFQGFRGYCCVDDWLAKGVVLEGIEGCQGTGKDWRWQGWSRECGSASRKLLTDEILLRGVIVVSTDSSNTNSCQAMPCGEAAGCSLYRVQVEQLGRTLSHLRFPCRHGIHEFMITIMETCSLGNYPNDVVVVLSLRTQECMILKSNTPPTTRSYVS
jgi:hypothetical protein